MVVKQRARRDEEKQHRRRTILLAARDLLEERAFTEFTIAAVAERVGLAKGTLFLYFETKEKLYLALLEEMLQDWFTDIDLRLDKLDADIPMQSLSTTLVDSLKNRKLFLTLLSLLESVLEHNIDYETAAKFKWGLLEKVTATGKRLEQRLPSLSLGEGTRLLLHIRALITGLHQMSNTSTVVAKVLEDPAMQVFRIEFEQELEYGLKALIDGFTKKV
ncbi:MAG: TetR family transcriptional regulator [Blastocatellia bacterium]|nr:TetR family transcriptional regulator [Blastocatellia bacterium]